MCEKYLKYFGNVHGFSYVFKMMEIHHKKEFSSIINIYFKDSKKLDKVYNDLKD